MCERAQAFSDFLPDFWFSPWCVFLPIQDMNPLLVVPIAHIRPESRSKA